jgi:hypothetical protein
VPYELALQEQFLLELVNAHRIEAGAPPLAWSEPLADAAREQARGLTRIGVLTHTGADGSTPVARMRRAGFSFSGRWAGAENVAWKTASAPESRIYDVHDLDEAFRRSEKHLRNRLDPRFQRFGAGFHLGSMTEEPDALLVAETYAFAGSEQILTGVAFLDRDGDDAFEPGEEMGGVVVEARPSGGGEPVRGVTRRSGGFELKVAPGDWTVVARREDGTELASARVEVASANVKVDLVGHAAGEPETLGEVRARGAGFAFKVRYPRSPAMVADMRTATASAPAPSGPGPEPTLLRFGPADPAALRAAFAPGDDGCDGWSPRVYALSITSPIAAIRSTFR